MEFNIFLIILLYLTHIAKIPNDKKCALQSKTLNYTVLLIVKFLHHTYFEPINLVHTHTISKCKIDHRKMLLMSRIEIQVRFVLLGEDKQTTFGSHVT